MNGRRYGAPMVIPMDLSHDAVFKPSRIPLDLRKIEEKWLQERIRAHPELLPVDQIEPAFAPLISVGREVRTRVGPIDNLFINTGGYVTIVETKLWRNPEARREVVGQIIDYAKELRAWSFEDLESEVKRYNRDYLGKELGIVDTIRRYEQVDESDEPIIVDTINRNLERGRFLLLVVGDGIRESVEAMGEFLAGTPQIHFTLALVEMELYEMEGQNDQLLVIPHVVARTREITRAVVRVEATDIKSIDVNVDTPGTTTTKTTLTESDFFDSLSQHVAQEDVQFAHEILGDMQTRGCVIDWRQASYVVKLPDPGESGNKLTLFLISKDGQVYIGWLASQLSSLGLPADIALEFAKDSAGLFGIQVHPKMPGWWSRNVKLGHLREKYDEFTALVDRAINNIVSASKEELQ